MKRLQQLLIHVLPSLILTPPFLPTSPPPFLPILPHLSSPSFLPILLPYFSPILPPPSFLALQTKIELSYLDVWVPMSVLALHHLLCWMSKLLAKSHSSLRGTSTHTQSTPACEQDFVKATWNAANRLFDSMKGKKTDGAVCKEFL